MQVSTKLYILNVRTFFRHLPKNVSVVLTTLFLLLLAAEALVLKKSIDIVLRSPAPLLPQQNARGVRFNFQAHAEVSKRLDGASTFEPSGRVEANPFRLKD